MCCHTMGTVTERRPECPPVSLVLLLIWTSLITALGIPGVF